MAKLTANTEVSLSHHLRQHSDLGALSLTAPIDSSESLMGHRELTSSKTSHRSHLRALGFDIFPPLQYTERNQELYDRFLDELLRLGGPSIDEDNLVRDQNTAPRRQPNCCSEHFKFRIVVSREIETLGCTRLPRRCDRFLRFWTWLDKTTAAAIVKAIFRALVSSKLYAILADRFYGWDSGRNFGIFARRFGVYTEVELSLAAKHFSQPNTVEGTQKHEEYSTPKDLDDWISSDSLDSWDDLDSSDDSDDDSGVSTSAWVDIDTDEIDGRLVASGQARRGTRLLAESPIMMVKDPTSAFEIQTGYRLLDEGSHKSFDKLKEPLQAKGQCATATTTFRASVCSVMSEDGEDFSAVFPTLSRFKRSEDPNTWYRWDDEEHLMIMHTTRFIPCGGDITVPLAQRALFKHHDLSSMRLPHCDSLGKLWIVAETLRLNDIVDYRAFEVWYYAADLAIRVGDKWRAKVFATRALLTYRDLAGYNSTTELLELMAEEPVLDVQFMSHPAYAPSAWDPPVLDNIRNYELWDTTGKDGIDQKWLWDAKEWTAFR